MSRRLRLALVLGALALPVIAQAQPRGPIPISVGRIASEKTCKLYEESAGRSAVVATPYAVAAASSWRTWLVRDCVDNFAAIRSSLESALAASGRFVVRPAGGAYVVTGRISDVGGDGGPAPRAAPVGEGGASVSRSYMFVNMDVQLRDPAGRAVFGDLFTKRMETGSDIRTDGFRSSSSDSGQALYTKLQHEVALTVARRVAFHLAPLTVTGGDGRAIQLNYGAPLLTLGTMLMVTSPDGSVNARYSVTAAGSGAATATLEGDGDYRRITPGSRAVVLEADDPAANGRRFNRVELP